VAESIANTLCAIRIVTVDDDYRIVLVNLIHQQRGDSGTIVFVIFQLPTTKVMVKERNETIIRELIDVRDGIDDGQVCD
jgi:hypothetical protein